MSSTTEMNSSDERKDFDISPMDTMYGYEGWQKRLKRQRDIKNVSIGVLKHLVITLHISKYRSLE